MNEYAYVGHWMNLGKLNNILILKNDGYSNHGNLIMDKTKDVGKDGTSEV